MSNAKKRAVLAWAGLILATFAYFVLNPGAGTLPLLLLVGIMVALAVTIYGMYFVLRWKNRVSFKALQLARQGDLEGAINLLKEEMRHHGEKPGYCSDVAVLLGLQGKWGEAMKMIEEAERLGCSGPTLLNNKGVALWKTGRLEEALPFLQDAVRSRPHHLLAVCNLGCVLAELGRADEARKELAWAERLVETQFVLCDAADREVRKQAIEDLRSKVGHLH